MRQRVLSAKTQSDFNADTDFDPFDRIEHEKPKPFVKNIKLDRVTELRLRLEVVEDC